MAAERELPMADEMLATLQEIARSLREIAGAVTVQAQVADMLARLKLRRIEVNGDELERQAARELIDERLGGGRRRRLATTF